MAENQSGRSWFRRAGSEFIDRAFLGNRGHDYSSGYWNSTGAKQGGIQGIATLVNPLAGFFVGKGLNAWNRNHQPPDAGQPMQPQRLPPPAPSNGMTPPPNLQMNINPNAGQPNYGSQGNYGNYTNPFVAPPAPDTGNVGGFSNGVFAGGQGNFGQNYAPPSGLTGLGNTQGGARGHYSQNGRTGDAARSMFSGMSDASRFNTNFDWMPKDRNS